MRLIQGHLASAVSVPHSRYLDCRTKVQVPYLERLRDLCIGRRHIILKAELPGTANTEYASLADVDTRHTRAYSVTSLNTLLYGIFLKLALHLRFHKSRNLPYAGISSKGGKPGKKENDQTTLPRLPTEATAEWVAYIKLRV